MSSTTAKFISLDEEGYFLAQGVRLQDEGYGRQLLDNLRVQNRAFVTTDGTHEIFVEAFDEPLVARHIDGSAKSGALTLQLPYGAQAQFLPETLRLDRWDRLHGRTTQGIPFVLSRSAQAEFFNLLSDFDDESITLNGKSYRTPTLDQVDSEHSTAPTPQFWEQKYQDWNSSGQAPGWELAQATPALTQVLPQLKIPKARWAVLGCGSGHDVAHLAQQGHLVTGVDLSPLAVEKARQQYTQLPQTQWACADAFKWAAQNRGQYDYVFEHTFFCAVDPSLRQEVAKTWRQLLAPGGHLLAVFFVMDRGEGPPFGASEWEIRELLKKDFQFLYWTRWRHSIPARQGKELVVYARKLNNN